MSISKKMLGAFFSLTLITLSLGVYAAWSISYMAEIAYDIYDRNLMSVSHARAGAIELNRTRMLLMQFGLGREELELELAEARTLSLPSDAILTGSVSPAETEASAGNEHVSERQRLLSAARLEFGEPAAVALDALELSERGRMIALARAQTSDPIARLLESSDLSERERLIAIARSQNNAAISVPGDAAEVSERERLIAIARTEGVVVAASDPPVMNTEKDAPPASSEPAADPQELSETVRDGVADVDGKALAEALTDQLETVVEEFEVVLERAASEGAVQLAGQLITDINSWMELNETLLSGEVAAGIVAPDALVQMIVKADELVEQVAADGFETRLHAEETVFERKVLTWVLLGLSFALALCLAWLMSKLIAQPLKRAVAAVQSLAEGNLNAEFETTARDELGDLAASLNVFKEGIRERRALTADRMALQDEQLKRSESVQDRIEQFEKHIDAALRSVAQSIDDLERTAGLMDETAETTRSSTAAATRVSQDAATEVEEVAGVSSRLIETVDRINEQVMRSGQITNDATDKARDTQAQMQNLVQSVEKIDQVMGLIASIADQTNLLALNATIEAARAGDAGRGFAVVANEVKSLAAQTASATEEVASVVTSVQSATGDAAVAIDGIGQVVENVREISDTIAAAISEQSAMMADIGGHAGQASGRTIEATQFMSNVGEAAQRTKDASEHVQTSSAALREQTARLRQEIAGFLSSVRAA